MTHDAARGRRGSPPRYLHHRGRDRGYANFRDAEGRRHQRMFPGRHGSPESLAAYRAFLEEWEAAAARPRPPGWHGRTSPAVPEVTVAVLADRFLTWAEREFQRDGRSTREAENYRDALKPVVALFAAMPAAEFGPRDLRAVRDAMIAQRWTAAESPARAGQARLARRTINTRIRRIRRVWKWGHAEGLVAEPVHLSLAALDPLKRGRGLRETAKVTAVADEDVEAVLEHVPPTVRSMILFAYHTGARPGEVCALRWRDVNRDGPVWLYTVPEHKTLHYEQDRVIAIGRRAQAALQPFAAIDPDEHVFSPKRAQRERRAERRASRRSKLTPSQRRRAQRVADNPAEVLGDAYTTMSFGRAIQRGVDAANAARLRSAIAADVAAELEVAEDELAQALELVRVCWLVDTRRGGVQLAEQYLAGKLASVVPDARVADALKVARRAAAAVKLVERWAPNRLRHSFENRAEARFDPTKASRALGHASAATVAHYMKKTGLADAIEVAAEIG